MKRQTISVLVALATLVAARGLALAGDEDKNGHKKPEVDPRYLNAKEIEGELVKHLPEIADCYKKHGIDQKGATGELRLELIIHREGTIFRLGVVAPGVKGNKLTKCVEKSAEQWLFPKKRGFTNAAVPLFFLKTGGNGPLMSCWNPKGCPKKRHAAKKKQPAKKQPAKKK